MFERNKIYCGDAFGVLKSFPDKIFQCCTTSPPYFGLRDYGVDGQIGLESTPEEYVNNLVKTFKEVRRVLRDDGIMWLNLGDSYAGSWGNSGHRPELDGSPSHQREKKTDYINRNGWDARRERPASSYKLPNGIKPKDLIGIPWMVAFALRADGWYLRSDIIWAKGNPMPESVTDRPTKGHEYMFLLSKNKKYYYDNVAILEPLAGPLHAPGNKTVTQPKEKGARDPGLDPSRTWGNANGRNKRTVWNINTKPYKAAHFATFPEALVEPCILAGTSEAGCCQECGTPWERRVEKKPMVIRRTDRMTEMGEFGRYQSSGTMVSPAIHKTLGWASSCEHENNGPVPCLVLDPFIGSGTTGLVSRRLGRDFVGIDLNPNYIELAYERINSFSR